MNSREIWGVASLCLALNAAGAALCFFCWGAGAALLLFFTGLTILAVFLLFTLWRYREIARLSRYLASVYAGGEPVDIRSQRPGELGALKDDIYKITTILHRQASQLAADKVFLADMLGNIAHQLKTPLAAILLQAELCQDEKTSSAAQRACAAQMQAQAERMQWLVETLLKLSRLDAHAVSFDKRPVDVQQLVCRAASGLAELFRQRSVVLEALCPPGLICVCDEQWTAEALQNLLKNCAEHTPPDGRVTVRCRDTALFFEFTVQDTGGGIPPGELPHLFTRFWRGAGAAPGGVGIGLPLARAIAEGQGGRLTAESTAEGATFRLCLYKSTL